MVVYFILRFAAVSNVSKVTKVTIEIEPQNLSFYTNIHTPRTHIHTNQGNYATQTTLNILFNTIFSIL